ncbi:MAG: glycosyltransferase [Myxococcales bacterium]|nr:glycosyltransferase [Myxococcales bacterium]
MDTESPRLLVHVVAYNAQETLARVLDRVPWDDLGPHVEVLVIDDSSKDDTFEVGLRYRETNSHRPITMLRNPVNQGYGGNQKLGYNYAIARGYEVVALLHGDGQYPPEVIPQLIAPIVKGDAAAVFGSRMMKRGEALRGGMPLYKFVGNKILTTFQNRVLGTGLSEFHSGFRAYSVPALARIPFERNTNDFHFDTEIIIQLLRAGLRIEEIPIPTYYGDEICHVNGMKYAGDVVRTTLRSRAQDYGLLYDRRFDIERDLSALYVSKTDFISSHRLAIDAVPEGAKVLDLGCGPGLVGGALVAEKGCDVTGLDAPGPGTPAAQARLTRFLAHDLDRDDLPAELDDDYDVILLLDIIEHMRSPERFLDMLRERFGTHRPRVIMTTGNVAFLPMRASLALGHFNYGPRGILDLTHTRLLTFETARALFDQAGYAVDTMRGIPAPYPLALGDNVASRALLGLNDVANRVAKGAFAYQIYLEARMAPTVSAVLAEAAR